MQQNITGVLDSVKARILPTLILFSALSVSASAAFYSVSGLSKLFAGAALEVMVMAGSLEIAKLVTATLLHRYWTKLSLALKAYLTVAVFILVIITSMGIYGFLSAAYQETFAQLTVQNNKIEFIQEKADFYGKDVQRYDLELDRISQNISTLSNAKATSIQIKDTTVAGGFRNSISTSELRMSQKRIDTEELNRKALRAKRDIASDSLQKYKLSILELKSDTDVAGELGPLQYLAGLLDMEMDVIINYLLLTIVFVFDPLAISLVLAANFAFDAIPSTKGTRKEEEEVLEEEEAEEDEEIEEIKRTLTVEDLHNRYAGAEWLPSVEEEQESFLESYVEDDLMYPTEEEIEEEHQKLYKLYGESGSVDLEALEAEFRESYPRLPNEDLEEDWTIEKEPVEDFEDSTKNIIIDEKAELKEKLRELKRYLKAESTGGINPRLERNLRNEIRSIENKIKEDDEDLTLTY